MAYEHTAVPVARSQEAIRKLILGNGGAGVAFVSQVGPPKTEGFEAAVVIDGKTYRIRISAECTPVQQKTRPRWSRASYRAARDNSDDAPRRVWRVLFYHLKSVYEAANSGVMEFRELMLPYIVAADNRTIAQHILPKLDKAIISDPSRLLPGKSE